jgi:hypothetical protein
MYETLKYICDLWMCALLAVLFKNVLHIFHILQRLPPSLPPEFLSPLTSQKSSAVHHIGIRENQIPTTGL